MLKKVPNIFNYSLFCPFILFLQSEKLFYIFNCGIIYFLSQPKKICYIFNCSVMYFFLV